MFEVVTRDLWNAFLPYFENPTASKVNHVFWMSSRSKQCNSTYQCRETVKVTQIFHMKKQNQRDVRYNFMIGGDGKVYEGRGFAYIPLVPKEYMRYCADSFIVGFIGSFTSVEEIPKIMYDTAKDLVDYGVANEYINPDFYFHDLLATPKKVIQDRRDVDNSSKRSPFAGFDFLS